MSISRNRIMVKKPGSYGALEFDETPLKEPGPDEVQVQVKACGINFADICVRLGLYEAARGSYPVCPGLEFSGVVSQIGEHAQAFKPGDRVFGASRFGAYTTAINTTPDMLWPLPDHWSFSKAAAFPVAYLTAWYGLHETGHLKKTDTVLVHSAAGGVGTAMIHLLKANDNKAVGVVGRSDKAFAVMDAGAAHVIDKQTKDLWKEAEKMSSAGYDMIADANGASTLKASYNHLKPGGRLLIYGFASMFSHTGRNNLPKLIWDYFRTPRFNPFDMTGSNKTVSGFNLIYLFDKVPLFRDIMDRLLQWDGQKMLPLMPITTFSFPRVADAHRAMESGLSVGKLVLEI